MNLAKGFYFNQTDMDLLDNEAEERTCEECFLVRAHLHDGPCVPWVINNTPEAITWNSKHQRIKQKMFPVRRSESFVGTCSKTETLTSKYRSKQDVLENQRLITEADMINELNKDQILDNQNEWSYVRLPNMAIVWPVASL